MLWFGLTLLAMGKLVWLCGLLALIGCKTLEQARAQKAAYRAKYRETSHPTPYWRTINDTILSRYATLGVRETDGDLSKRPWRHMGLVAGVRRHEGARAAHLTGLSLSWRNLRDTVVGIHIGAAEASIDAGVAIAPIAVVRRAGIAIGGIAELRGWGHRPWHWFQKRWPSWGIAAGIIGIAEDHARGLLIGGMNFLGGEEEEAFMGVAVAFIGNQGEDMRGLQVAGVNMMMDSKVKGLQVGAGNVAGDMRGLQVGAVNYADSVRGLQLGAINVVMEHKGLQIGLLNVMRGNQRHRWMPLVNWPSRKRRMLKAK